MATPPLLKQPQPPVDENGNPLPPPPPANFGQFAANPAVVTKAALSLGHAPPLPPPGPPPMPSQAAPQPALPPIDMLPPKPSTTVLSPVGRPAGAPAAPSAGATAPTGLPDFAQWQQQHPEMQEQPHGGLIRALAVAAGLMRAGAGAGIQAGIDEALHDRPANLQMADLARYNQAVMQPAQARLALDDTASQIAQRQSSADKNAALADADTPRAVDPVLAERLGLPAGTQLTASGLRYLLGTHMRTDSAEGIAQAHDQTRQDIADESNQTRMALAQQKPKQRDDQYISIMEKPRAAWTPEDAAFVAAYRNWIQASKTQPGVARAAAYANMRPVTVVDPNDPTNAVYESAGQAIRSRAGSPQGARFQTARAESRYMTSGTGGQNLNTLNTAYGHLDQLSKLTGALGNGDAVMLNRLAQDYAQQTGSAAPTNFDAVRNAVAGEVSKTFKGGGATDAEIREINSNINRAQSPKQLAGVIAQYQGLLQSKRDALQQQFVLGMQGKPNFQGEAKGALQAPLGQETRTYQGHTYVKGPNGWQLQP